MTGSEQAQLDRIAAEVADLDDKVDDLRTRAAAADETRRSQSEGLARVELRLERHTADTTARFDQLTAKLDTLAQGQASAAAALAASRRPWGAAEFSGFAAVLTTLLGGVASIVYALTGHPSPPPTPQPSPSEITQEKP